jgi:hypothetical protein
MVPGAVLSAQKRAYSNQDMADWVRHWNAVNGQQNNPDKPIHLRFPDKFPIRTPTLLRCAIANSSCIPLLCTFPLLSHISQCSIPSRWPLGRFEPPRRPRIALRPDHDHQDDPLLSLNRDAVIRRTYRHIMPWGSPRHIKTPH